MAGSTIRTTAIAIGIALGSSGAVVLVGIFFIGMLVMSLIPIYTPNSSTAAYGDVYRIPGLIIKAIYTNVTVNITAGSVLSLVELSSICTSILRAKNIKNFYACVAQNFTAYGPTGVTDPNSPFVRRRRALNDVALYEIGDILILYSTTCSNPQALKKWSLSLTGSQNSSCVAQRTATCRSFISNPSAISSTNQWLPFPNAYTQLLSYNGTNCMPIGISAIYNVAYTLYTGVDTRYNITRTDNVGDCQYDRLLAQSDLRNLVNSEFVTTTSTCSSIGFG